MRNRAPHHARIVAKLAWGAIRPHPVIDRQFATSFITCSSDHIKIRSAKKGAASASTMRLGYRSTTLNKANELKQERFKWLEKARKLREQVASEDRCMNKAEIEDYNAWHRAAHALSEQIAEEEGIEEAERSAFENGEPSPLPPGDMPQVPRFTQVENYGETRRLRPGETRAISSRESVQKVLRLTGPLTFGQYVRALTFGARSDAEKRALGESTGSGGGYTVPEYLASQYIDTLRAASVINAAGARTIPLQSADHSFAKLASDASVAWHVENAADLEAGDPTFGAIKLSAYTLVGLVKIPEELTQDSPNIEEIVTSSLSKALALELDRAAIYGTGANQPTGIVNYGITSTSKGTGNGAAVTDYSDLLALMSAQETANALPITAFVMHPRTKYEYAVLVDDVKQQLRKPAELANIPFLSTTLVPITEIEGSSNNASTVIAGHWPDLLIGVRFPLTLQILREAFAANHQIGVKAVLRVDTALTHVESFRKLAGIIPA
jgi:HK97 family phage major capsid protein